MRSWTGLSTPGKLSLGLVALFVLFLLRIKNLKQVRSQKVNQMRPMDFDFGGSKWLSLAPYIEAQARHETGNYTSRLANENNNLFGMKKPLQRAFFGTGSDPAGYAIYSSPQDSIRDLLEWFRYNNFPGSVSGSAQYVAELKKRKYFEDSQFNYLKGINSHLSAIGSGNITWF